MATYCRKLLLFPILIFTSLLISSCATTGPGGKKSIILISTNQEMAIGQQMDQQLRETEIRNGAAAPLDDIYDEDIYDESIFDEDIDDFEDPESPDSDG